jgi:hypothetical protein
MTCAGTHGAAPADRPVDQGTLPSTTSGSAETQVFLVMARISPPCVTIGTDEQNFR